MSNKVSIIGLITVVLVSLGISMPAEAVVSPALFFSDITSGPNTGLGDGLGQGAIVAVWGSNLGSSQDNSKIYVKDSLSNIYEASYVYYWKNADGQLPGGPADLYSSHKMQEVAFSIPSAAAQGLGEIYVEVNGVKSNSLPFTIRSGNIYFVKTTGSDSTGDGSWNNPYKTFYRITYDSSSNIQDGDIIYGVGIFSESNGQDGLRIRASYDGTLSRPISAIVYPNSKVTLYASRYGIKNYDSDADFWNFAKFDVQSSAGGIESFREGRIVGNSITDRELDLGASGCATGAGGAIAGTRRANGNMGPSGAKIFGNYIHDFGCVGSSILHHVFYISNRNGTSVKSYELAWNHLKDNMVANGLHIYDTGPCGDWTGPMEIHHNVVVNQRAKGFNIGGTCDSGRQISMPVNVYNNLFINTGTGPEFYNTGNTLSAIAVDVSGNSVYSNVNFYHNTIYDYSDDTVSPSITKRALNSVHPGTYNWRNNIVVDVKNLPYITSYQPKYPSQRGNNIWYDGGDGIPSTPPIWDISPITSSPLFNNPSENDFTLQSTSPARDAGVDVGISTDLYGNPRDSNPDIGAFEYLAGTVSILGDINDDGVVGILDLQACVNVFLGTETDPNFIQRAKEVAEPKDECNVLDVQGIVNIILTP